MGVGLVSGFLSVREVLSATGPTSTFEGRVESQDRREVQRTDSNGVRRTETRYDTVIRYAGGTVSIGAGDVYFGVDRGDSVRVELSDRTGEAVGLPG